MVTGVRAGSRLGAALDTGKAERLPEDRRSRPEARLPGSYDAIDDDDHFSIQFSACRRSPIFVMRTGRVFQNAGDFPGTYEL